MDSRRVTGPNVFWARPGAVLDVALADDEVVPAIEAWSTWARRLLDAVGWQDEATTTRVYGGGVSLVISAPVDALYAATGVNEAAWEAAEAELDGRQAPDLAALVTALEKTIAEETNPLLIDLQSEAAARDVAFTSDDDHLSIGLGAGSRTWSVNQTPAIDSVDWAGVHDVPLALITGTNGKTTTVRLLAAMVAAADLVPGVSSTDWLKVGDETLDQGDWSGPGGARTIVRDRRVEVAILETARGGMLRRGLGVTAADVAAILNVAEDHLGEWGVEDLAALVEAKFIVSRVARQLVLNADDPSVVARASSVEAPITWFGLDIAPDIRRSALESGQPLFTVLGGSIHRVGGSSDEKIVELARVPITLGGAARHNVSNALAAAAVAEHLGLARGAIRQGLETFRSDPEENPGRLNQFELGDIRVLVDFAHNPHGLEALLEMAAALPAQRRLVLIGQAGDRTDTSIRELAQIIWRTRPERVVIKEMPKYLRGREAGVVPQMIADELVAAGAPDEAIERAGSELEGVRQALQWARPGDLLLILTHESRTEVLRLFAQLQESTWRPGQPLPDLADL